MKRKLLILRLLLCNNGYKRAEYLKRINYFHHQGEHCFFIPFNYGTEPYLISFGNNVHVASGVTFINHDVSSMMFSYMEPLQEKALVKRVGKIEIGDHVFIGAGSTILYDVKIGSHVIIAAGSLVNHDIPDGCIYGGVPARKIGEFDSYLQKNIEFSKKVNWNIYDNRKTTKEKQMEYFWKNERGRDLRYDR